MLGRQTGNNISYANGKVTRQYVQTVILFAQKPGKYKINSAKVKIDGKPYESNPVKIKITKPEEKQTQKSSLGGAYVKMDIILSKDEVYPNENIIADVKLYAKSYDLLRRRSDIIAPGISGFRVKQLSKNEERNFEQEIIDGEVYVSEEIAKYQLTPIQIGTLEIPEFKIRLAIPIDLFDEKIVLLKTEPKTVEVKNLPNNAPKSFNGAIGKFILNSELEDKEYHVNEPIELEFELIGEGNLSSIELPELSLDPKLEIYKPQRRNAYKETIHGEKGKIVNKYVIVPQYGGSYTIPEMVFSFFNIETDSYETIHTKSFNIEVESEGIEEDNQDNVDAETDTIQDTIIPEKVQEINNRVKELIKIPNLNNPPNSSKKWYWILLLIPVIGIAIFFIIKNKKDKKTEAKIVEKDKKAIIDKIKESLDKLEIAKNHQNINDFTTESSIILNQVVALFSDKEEVAIYTESEASEILLAKVSDTFLSRWEKLHRRNLLMRYSGILSKESLSELYTEYEILVKDSINK